MGKRSVHTVRRNVASWGTLERFLRLLDTDGRIDLGDGMRSAADLQTLKERLVELAEALGGKAPSSAALKLWGSVLKDFPIETICDAFTTWAKTKTKMPAPADIAGICAARLSDRIESEASARKGEYARGSARILADPRVARMHLGRCLSILRGPDAELAEERRCMALQDDPL